MTCVFYIVLLVVGREMMVIQTEGKRKILITGMSHQVVETSLGKAQANADFEGCKKHAGVSIEVVQFRTDFLIFWFSPPRTK